MFRPDVDRLGDVLEAVEKLDIGRDFVSRTKNERKCHQSFKTCTYEQFKDVNPDRLPGTCQ